MAPLFNSSPEHNSIRRTPSQASQPRSFASGATQRTDIFSDDFALERIETGEMTPTDSSIQGSANSTHSEHNSSNRPQSMSASPETNLTDDENASTSLRVTKESSSTEFSSQYSRNSILAQQHGAGPRRSLSVSSNFSMESSPSPYNGPTAPTQPYAMYPQVTRASSVTSGSTVRPMERPFISQGGPEHPYGMYQNTVPEEEDDDVETTNGVPPVSFGATAMMASSLGGSSSSGNDTGDIVGSDGHIEQLPPYTRYADNVVAKGDMADINRHVSTLEDQSPSMTDASGLTPNQSSSEAEINLSPSGEEQRELARKEGVYERSKKRKCCGVPLIIVVLLIVVIIISAAVGGVVGGIVGNRKGVDHATAASASTTTLWLDADPIETGPLTPSCPTGHYTIDFENIGNIDKCVSDPALTEVWDCQDKASLGITVMEDGPRGSGDITIQFDDYSNRPQLFAYGPQPPDFNGTKFNMNPVEDRDNRDYGVAMFFSYLFDKIVILPANDLNPQNPHKRDALRTRLNRRASYSGYLRPGDTPWYCYWNQTVEEFWVFLEQEVTSSASPAAMSVSPTLSGYPKSTATSGSQTSPTPSPTVAAQAFYEKVYPEPTPADWTGPEQPQKRDASPTSNSGSRPIFPKMIKMIEKRKPFGNIEPYCQQMIVGENYAIVPTNPSVVVNIDEEEFQEFPQYAQPSGNSKRSLAGSRGMSLVRRDAFEIIGDLESLCICEWRYP